MEFKKWSIFLQGVIHTIGKYYTVVHVSMFHTQSRSLSYMYMYHRRTIGGGGQGALAPHFENGGGGAEPPLIIAHVL